MTSSSRQARPLVGSEPADNSQQLVAHLKEDIACRRIESGIARLNSHSSLLTSMTPGPNEAALAGHLAQWADIGFSGPELVKDILARFAHDARAGLPLRAYLYLRLAEGWVALAEEASEQAIQHLDLVLALGDEFDDKQSLAIANFWKGRCLRKKGEYDEALVYTVKGRDLAQGLGHSAMAAPMRVLESWLLFQRGRSRANSCVGAREPTT